MKITNIESSIVIEMEYGDDLVSFHNVINLPVNPSPYERYLHKSMHNAIIKLGNTSIAKKIEEDNYRTMLNMIIEPDIPNKKQTIVLGVDNDIHDILSKMIVISDDVVKNEPPPLPCIELVEFPKNTPKKPNWKPNRWK